MLLSELIRAVSPGLIQRRGSDDLDPDVGEVLLDDGATPMGAEQVVLAIRSGQEQALVDRARAAGCQAVVVPPGVPVAATASVAILESEVPWTQLFVLLRTMLLASHDEASDDTGPSSVHGLADAIAVMVGGSVVLYDRAHRVVAYSVQGHEIDQVRRDTILGRRTPDQWVRRFTIDRTAYQTYIEPGRVVRVTDYPDLHTRLRIAVHAGNEVIGEISAAEGASPFPPHAEKALRRAARLAVPVMLRHQRAQDADRTSRERAVRTLLREGVLPAAAGVGEASALSGEMYLLGFSLEDEPRGERTASRGLASERFVHFLSLHMRSIDASSLVAPLDGVYWAVVAAASTTSDRLARVAEVAVRQLMRMGVRPNVAIGPRARRPEAVPAAKRIVEDLLAVAQAANVHGQVLTPEASWAELVLRTACRGLGGDTALPPGPIDGLRAHDQKNDSDLVTTLATFLDEFGSISAAAAKLFLHPNTLRHRMQRIEEVSGLALDNADHRLAAALLLRAGTFSSPPKKPVADDQADTAEDRRPSTSGGP